MNNIFIKNTLIALGWVFVALGFIGMVLPLLPSTIFFIIASYIFARSSDKFNNWLLNHKIIGGPVRNFIEKKGMTLKAKFVSITLLFITILSSIVITGFSMIVFVLLTSVAFGVSTLIISLNTIPQEINKEM